MSEIPLPWVVTILVWLAAFVCARSRTLPYAGRVWLAAGLASLGVVGVLLGLRLTYGQSWALFVQPFVALCVAGGLYLGLEASTIDGAYPWRRKLMWHGVPLALSALAMAATKLALADVLIPLITVVYVILLIRLLLRPPEAYVHTTPSSLRLVRGGILATCVLFAAFFVGDLAILVSMAVVGPEALPGMVTLTTQVLTALVLAGAIAGTVFVFWRAEAEPSDTSTTEITADDEDRAVLAQFDTLLREARLYTDPNLTLARAARRLGLPARTLSRAVNRAGKTNVSRHINGFRIRHAQALLRDTDLPVTDVMLEAGFLSKSAFNTEFRRITGLTPSDYRAQAE